MLKTMLLVRLGKDIKNFEKVKAFLKKKSFKYKVKKSEAFTVEQISDFLRQADDNEYLVAKVALLFGIFGACRKGELVSMKIQHITEHKDKNEGKDHLLVEIPETKTGIRRSFVVVGHPEDAVNALLYYKKYFALRPTFSQEGTHQDRFFLKYLNGKCSRQPLGLHNIGGIPYRIATFLHLDNPKRYTGHAIRRSSATWLAHTGVDLLTLKRLAGWKSSTVAESYIAESISNKRTIAEKLIGCIDSPLKKNQYNEQENIAPSFNISNCANVTISIYNTCDKNRVLLPDPSK